MRKVLDAMRKVCHILKEIWDALFTKPGEMLRGAVQFVFVIGLVGSFIGSIVLGVIVGDEMESVLLAVLTIPVAFLLLAIADYLLILPMLCFAELVINSGKKQVVQLAPEVAPVVKAEQPVAPRPVKPQQPVPAAQPAKSVQPVPERKPAVKKQLPVSMPASVPKSCVTMKDILEYSLRFESARGMVDYLRVKGASVTPEEKTRLDAALNAADPRAAVLAWVKELSEQEAAD